MGIEVEMIHKEVAEGQYEIDFKYDTALKTADNALTFKYVVQQVATENEMHATFMAKPFAKVNGSGMHVHQSLWSNGKNGKEKTMNI